jgi:hypothetical protein
MNNTTKAECCTRINTMAYHNANTLRAISTLRPVALVFGPSATDRLIGDLRRALDGRPGYTEMYAAACAKLGQANRTKPQWRRTNQGGVG